MTRRTIRGLIFDFDGTIADTEVPAFESWQEIYQEHGCSLPFSQWSAVLGGSGVEFDACAYLESLSGATLDREAIRARRQQRKAELVALAAVLPGVVSYLDAADRLGLRVGLASSSPRSWVIDHLSRLGLVERFGCISCADDVAQVKPDPALYLLTLSKMGLRPEEAIVLEDSPNGVRAANAAGIFCVAVPNPLTAQLDLNHADLRLASMADLPLEDLIALVERVAPVAR